MGVFDSISNQITNSASGIVSSVRSGVSSATTGLLSASMTRLNAAGLLPTSTAKPATSVNWLNAAGQTQCSGVAGNDWRVRISVAPTAPILYKSGNNEFLDPIFKTSGVIFPIAPNIQTTHSAKYSSSSPTHSNYAMHFYESSEVAAININAEFPIQNIPEGQYLLAAIYFFRAATKMYWGWDEYAGTPPPMVFLDGYGEAYFPHVPCVVTSFTHTMPEDKDYIEVPSLTTGFGTRLPTQSTLQVTLQPVYSRKAMADFGLEELASGEMLGGGFI